ncbi:SAM-dependent methyltransferase [Paenibacillus nanensis]|uniref:SAM-dependent methyltransferase n=1 Tax=Paenibacillus nanensis TaxID=393251 RepID=A0A3A1UVF5_9BACL|nr:class I SAM-dependent methyltransferase [Paenibacillus nanensis]RIX50273.1 SAM-dependent methyltransferase [Paenibacillus nanensis]
MQERRSTYRIQHASLGFESEMKRLENQAHMGWSKEFRNMKWYGLGDGMEVLELGSGPAYFTEQLVRNLPQSQVTALEIDKLLITKAEQMLSDIPDSRLRFVEASVYETGLPDHAFDFAVARLLFLHLYHPLDAAKEIFRVLKPGGKFVIIDVDDGIFGAIHPEPESLQTILGKIAEYIASRGGNRYLGRTIPRLMQEAGFIDIELDATLQHSDIHGLEGFKEQFNIQLFKRFLDIGVLEAAEFEHLQVAADALHTSPDAFAMMSFVMGYGTKPINR